MTDRPAQCDRQTDAGMHPITHPTTNEELHYFINSNVVARGYYLDYRIWFEN